jgi:AcrR family transcriptional regulator
MRPHDGTEIGRPRFNPYAEIRVACRGAARVYSDMPMDALPSYREANRARLREALVGAARELTVSQGWAAVRMVDVAAAVGVSRQTVYNEFGDRAGLAEALTATEIRLFLDAVRAELVAHGPDVRAATHAAILRTLTEAARSPLVRAILTSGRGGAAELLPFLTSGTEVVREWATASLPDADPAAVTLAADAGVRLTISHAMLPLTTPEQSATAIAEVFTRLLA